MIIARLITMINKTLGPTLNPSPLLMEKLKIKLLSKYENNS